MTALGPGDVFAVQIDKASAFELLVQRIVSAALIS